MNVSYKKLWKLLIDRGINKSSLQSIAHIGSRSIAKLGKNENVNTDTLVKICNALSCDISDIMEMEQERYNTEKVEYKATTEDRQEKRIAISLFSGAGGMDIGVRQAGFHIASCTEIDKNCCDTLRNAIKKDGLQTEVFEGDIRSQEALDFALEMRQRYGEIDLLFGGPPCQAFSLIGKQQALDDERGMLLFQMTRYTKALQPKVVLMEEVKGLLSAKDSQGKRCGVIEKLLKEFKGLGYVAKYQVCLAANYGVAQLRERVFLVAIKGENGFIFPQPSHGSPDECNGLFPLKLYRTVGDVLANLPAPHLKEPGKLIYDDSFMNHVDVTPARDRERMHYVPEGDYLAHQTGLPMELRCKLSPKDTTKFLRLDRRKPSNTLRCGEIFYHPTEDRYLTPREYMRIHGYPDDYILKGPIRSRTGVVRDLDQHRQVANSVPPPMAFAIASQVIKYLEENGI